jgi:serine protease AprX
VVAHKNDDPANPIRVINLSYGTAGSAAFWVDPVQFAVEKAWKAGIVVVTAAGNNGNGSAHLTNPATSPWGISVGAADTKNTLTTNDDWLSTFTNTDSGRPLDLLAPGVSIASLRDPGSAIDQQYATARVGETLFRGSGTSQAAAITSAAVALLLQARPTLTPDKVKYNLVETSTWLPNGIAATRGFKMVNLAGALTRNTTVVQGHSAGVGNGPIEGSRGPSHVVRDSVSLTGEKSVWGAVSSANWAAKSAAKTAWVGGSWMGYTVTGSGWTGTSWASKTWASATWTGGPWGASSSWVDPEWSGRYWSGRYWSGTTTWSGRYWSSDTWAAAYWG